MKLFFCFAPPMLWALGIAAMIGYFGVKQIESNTKGPPTLVACALWPVTLPFMLAYGLGCYIRIRLASWYDQS